MLKVIVCDDNDEILNNICDMIYQNITYEFHLSMYNNSFALTDYIFEKSKGDIDLLIIDIDLGNDSGIEIAAEIVRQYPHIKIIFISGHLQYTIDIFDVQPVYFLHKPFDDSRLVKAFEKAYFLIEQDKMKCIPIINRGEILNVRLSSINYIESNRRVAIIHEQNSNREANMKLDEIQNKLPFSFLRCHQSYIVNMDRIKRFNLNGAELFSGEIVPVSRPKYSETKKVFLKYLGEKV